MSAFIVADDTINQIVSRLIDDRENEWQRRQLMQVLKLNDRSKLEAKLGTSMFALNVLAVEERYGQGEAEKFRPLDYKPQHELTDAIQALKSLQCWLYQCSEGAVPQMPLFLAMREVAYTWMERIISNLPAYDRAQWG